MKPKLIGVLQLSLTRTVIFLCKQSPQGKDLCCRPYGRFFHLPKYITESGYNVILILANYSTQEINESHVDGVDVRSVPVLLYPFYVNKLSATVGVDIIVAFSDTYYGILAAYIAKKRRIKYVIDAYDNYEAYIPWAKPLHWLWRKALRNADAITAAGPNLLSKISENNEHAKLSVVPMAADPCFYPLNREACRTELRLPTDKKIVGYVGTISHDRGINLLFESYLCLRETRPDLELVLSGRISRNVSLPSAVTYLGYLPDTKIPKLLNSLDVSVVMNLRSDFGEFSYPIKLYESIACNIPVLVAATQASNWIMRENQETLFSPGDVEDLTRKLSRLLDGKKSVITESSSWVTSAKEFVNCLDAV